MVTDPVTDGNHLPERKLRMLRINHPLLSKQFFIFFISVKNIFLKNHIKLMAFYP